MNFKINMCIFFDFLATFFNKKPSPVGAGKSFLQAVGAACIYTAGNRYAATELVSLL